jgi:hypothetical protein
VFGKGNGATPTPTRGVPVKLDRERHLRYSMATLRKMREVFKPGELEGGVTDDKIVRVLWFGLRDDDPELTEAQIEDMVDMENLDPLMEALNKALGSRGSARLSPQPPPPAASAVAPE